MASKNDDGFDLVLQLAFWALVIATAGIVLFGYLIYKFLDEIGEGIEASSRERDRRKSMLESQRRAEKERIQSEIDRKKSTLQYQEMALDDEISKLEKEIKSLRNE